MDCSTCLRVQMKVIYYLDSKLCSRFRFSSLVKILSFFLYLCSKYYSYTSFKTEFSKIAATRPRAIRKKTFFKNKRIMLELMLWRNTLKLALLRKKPYIFQKIWQILKHYSRAILISYLYIVVLKSIVSNFVVYRSDFDWNVRQCAMS